uniref:Uncharacterized protein n=1 Tax=Salix viminalis TaxID=40686 RepID=A0A6N2LE82_SALVM
METMSLSQVAKTYRLYRGTKCLFYLQRSFVFAELFGSSEVSDQNFVEKDQGEKLSCVHMLKRSRTSEAEASSNDQAVPFTRSDTRDVSTASQSSSERVEQVHQELLSENPDNFVCENRLHYFLRGS